MSRTERIDERCVACVACGVGVEVPCLISKIGKIGLMSLNTGTLDHFASCCSWEQAGVCPSAVASTQYSGGGYTW